MIAAPALALSLSFAVAAVREPPPENVQGAASYSRRVWQSADGLPEDFAQALAQTPDGYLWIGTSGGLVRFDGVRFAVFHRATEPAFRDDSVYALLVTRDGTLWAGTEGGGLVRYRQGSLHLRRRRRPQRVRARDLRGPGPDALGRDRRRPVPHER
jgi:ligand-binding sensor domain-containing protein